MSNLALYIQPYDSASLNDFLEALDQSEIHFSSKSLAFVFHSPEEMQKAISRAMNICSSIGMPLRQHFRRRFLSDSTLQTLEVDWSMSKLAYCLMLMNGSDDNPIVARFQWELIKKMV